jgi:hypothetical protein
MSEQRPHPGHCGEDVAAYALGALEPAEADAFRRHLQSCPVCPEELAAFQQVVDTIAATTPPRPAPRALRARIMRAVEDEPRLHASSPRRRRSSRLRVALPRPALTLPAGALALAVAAVAVVLALGSGGSSRTVAAQVTGRGEATVHVSDGHAQLVVHDFPAAPRGHIYEVWLERGSGTPQPTTALFGVTRTGDASVDVPGSLHGVSHVLVTAEPAGGTRVPTTTPVIDARLG